ncbi:MAG: hypothetical protein O3C49_03430 [Proteobacteria bacterium]|nr:hypothetical protein [Pseudomonadota bacterium]
MLFIHNDVVKEILTMEDCIAAQEQAFRDLAVGKATHRPRSDIYAPCEREAIPAGAPWKAVRAAIWRSA